MPIRNVDDDLKPMTRWLDAIVAEGFHSSRVFRDWVELMLMDKMNDRRRCAEILSGYGMGDKITPLFAEATAALTQCFARERREFLGRLFNVYVDIGVEGNCILPYACCLLKVADAPNLLSGGLTCDTACGAGGVFVAFIRLRSRRANQCSIYAGLDRDRTCAQMTVLNLNFCQVSGVAVWGDSSAGKIWEGWGNLSFFSTQIVRAVSPEKYDMVLQGVLHDTLSLSGNKTAAS